MDEQALENGTGLEGYGEVPADGSAEVRGSASRPRFSDPEAWHDLAERGTPRNG